MPEVQQLLQAVLTSPEFESLAKGEVDGLLEKRGVSAMLRPFLSAIVVAMLKAEIAKLTAAA